MIDFNLKSGLTGQAVVTVTEENTAKKFGSGSVNVFATPAMIGLMEKASIEAVDHLLPDEYATVGTKIDVKHLAPTPIGMIVIAKAGLEEIEGKKLKFKVEAFDEVEKIGEGTHYRYIVNLNDFLINSNKKISAI
jgi:predicted thioesterase